MKPWFFRTAGLGLLLSALPLVASSDDANTASSPSQPDSITTPADAAPAVTVSNNSVMPAPPPADLARPLPATVNPTGPAADVVKLAQAGVNEDVMLAYVNNSASAFNLGSQEIIYLNDLGVPDAVVTAMIQRDQVLKAPVAVPATETPPPAAAAAPVADPPAADATPPPTDTAMADNTPPPMDAVAPDVQLADDTYGSPDYSDFYDALSPYGSWVNLPDYGWCWQPYVVVANAGWQPYCDRGRWYYTNCGWYWHSYYSWGGVAFHYGRWFNDPHRGWCWWPERTWGPAWVGWRYDNLYCGWAALPPGVSFRAGVGLSAGLHAGLALGSSSFTFVPWGSLGDAHPASHRLGATPAAAIFNGTTALNDIVPGSHHNVINHGLTPTEVAQFTTRTIPHVDLRQSVGGPIVTVIHNGHTVFVESPKRPEPMNNGASVMANSVRAYGTVGAVQRSYVPQNNGAPSAGPTEPLIIHGNYTPAAAAAAGWTGGNRNVTVIGQSFAPPHNGNPYATYSTGPSVNTPRYQAPTVQNYSYQDTRYSSPAPVYTPSSSAPAPRYETHAYAAPTASYPSYSAPAYNPPVREEPAYTYSAPARQQLAPQTSYSSSGSSRGYGYKH